MTTTAPHEMSEYEMLRQEKIQRNEQRLKELGLNEVSAMFQGEKRKRKTPREDKKKNPLPAADQASSSSLEAPRRSSRKRKVLDYKETSAVVKNEVTDDSSDDDEDLSESEYEGDDSEEEEAAVVREPRSKKSRTDDDEAAAAQDQDAMGGLTLELAKTGRSTCRGRCGNKIEKAAPRVGMRAWIMGRQSVTWQCPTCFLQNLTCARDLTGRGRCKATNRSFEKKELKVGARSHTATSYYKLDAVVGILAKVIDWVPSGERDNAKRLLRVENIDGHDRLSVEDTNILKSVLERAIENTPPSHSGTRNTEKALEQTQHEKKVIDTKKEKKKSTTKGTPQPKSGSVSRAKGKVTWKFGGHTCYGTLISNKESKTHCYARTHKGNVKTLAKGKDYWSIL